MSSGLFTFSFCWRLLIAPGYRRQRPSGNPDFRTGQKKPWMSFLRETVTLPQIAPTNTCFLQCILAATCNAFVERSLCAIRMLIAALDAQVLCG